MGYYTDFTFSIVIDANAALGIETLKETEQRVCKAILELDTEDSGGYLKDFVEKLADGTVAFGDQYGNFKWYSHEEDMRRLSSKCGDILFKLEGKGEEDEDRWIKYFMNGRMQRCPATITITYDEFDPEKMR